jgi:hypothetical protein
MAHVPRRKVSIQQEGGSVVFRGPDEIAGNSALTRALDSDLSNSLQVNEIFTGISVTTAVASITVPAPSPATFGVATGDFLTIEGMDGYFLVNTIVPVGPNFRITIQNNSLIIGAGTVVSNIFSSDIPFNFTNAGILPGDALQMLGTAGKRNRDQIFNILEVNGFTLTLDGVPVDDSDHGFSIYRPPQRPFIHAHLVGASGLVVHVSKAPVSSRGAPSLTRFPGFGDAALSSVVNRSSRALAQNTRYLKSIVEGRLAIPTRHEVAAGHGGTIDVDLSTVSETGGLWTGEIGGVLTPTSSEISKHIRVVDPNGFDIDVGGVDVKVDDIRSLAGGLGISLLNRGFVRSTEDSAAMFARFNLTIPTAQAFAVVFGKGESLEDLVVSDRGAFMKGETLLTGINEEIIPELINSRVSDRFGSYGSPTVEGLDARLESIEDRLTLWAWTKDPNIRFTLIGPPATLITIEATSIIYDGTTYTLASPVQIPVGIAAGHIRADLDSSGNTLSFTLISESFDPESLTGNPIRQIIVAYFNSGPDKALITFNRDGKDSDIILASEPEFEITKVGTAVELSWRGALDLKYRGRLLKGLDSSAATVRGHIAGSINLTSLPSPAFRIQSDDFHTGTSGIDIALASATKTATAWVADINAAITSAFFPYKNNMAYLTSRGTIGIRSVKYRGESSPALRILPPGAGDDARELLFGINPGAFPAFYDADYGTITVSDGEILYALLTEASPTTFDEVDFILITIPNSTLERRNDVIQLLSNTGGNLVWRGSSSRLSNYLLIRNDGAPEFIDATDVVGNPVLAAGVNPRVITADRSPHGIGVAWIETNGTPANRDIFFALISDGGASIVAGAEIVDISDVTDYIGLPVSDDPTDIAIHFCPVRDVFTIAWGDQGTDPGIYTVEVNALGTVTRLARRSHNSGANDVYYVDVTSLQQGPISSGDDLVLAAITGVGTPTSITLSRTDILGVEITSSISESDSIEKRGIAIVCPKAEGTPSFAASGTFGRAYLFYSKNTTGTSFRIRGRLVDIENAVGGFTTLKTTVEAAAIIVGTNVRVDAILNTRGLLTVGASWGADQAFSSEVTLNLESAGAGPRITADPDTLRATSPYRKNLILIAGDRNHPDLAAGAMVLSVTDGTGGDFAANETILDATRYALDLEKAKFIPSMAEALSDPILSPVLINELTGDTGLNLRTGSNTRSFVVIQTVTEVGASITADTTVSTGTFIFSTPFLNTPEITITPIYDAAVTGSDRLLWSIDASTVTPNSFSARIRNTGPAGTVTGSVRALIVAYGQ